MKQKPANELETGSKLGNGKVTHREEIAERGDYLGRKPGVATEVTLFDEEALVDESQKGAKPGGETEQPA